MKSKAQGFIKVLVVVFIGVVAGCKEEKAKNDLPNVSIPIEINHDSIVDTPMASQELVVSPYEALQSLNDTTFVRLADYSGDFVYDMRYATENNFLKAKVYDCAECYTRVKTAKALLLANEELKKKGFKIKFFDCYRPHEVQFKMWAIVPNPQYVANPVRGSIHNKGGAVDITLVTLDGQELDMGTDFDFFGKRAYHDNLDLPQPILNNRLLLKQTMEKYGFWSIRTEWWHYNLSSGSNDEIADFRWDCP
ncbi:M15 family metallopeptidase [Arenibacter sp. 6A1]|uniref:M15 family metallopeptidase n=1 Tax=Arenibacter sp. 6A1 TaxID=2720391 RepID=UPI001448414E|nr:M15 family metallopeptidase [Arenibacter sp. 6A1]NKI27069.1 M15 family metallopeptidase [Arenibacter sp. 6A1]